MGQCGEEENQRIAASEPRKQREENNESDGRHHLVGSPEGRIFVHAPVETVDSVEVLEDVFAAVRELLGTKLMYCTKHPKKLFPEMHLYLQQ